MSTYSAFFSSGLLAPPSLYPKTNCTSSSSPVARPVTPDRSLAPSSPGPACGSSPMPVPYDMNIEEADVTMDNDDDDDGDGDMDTEGRAPTPTPSSVGARSRSGSVTSVMHHHQRQQSQSQPQGPNQRKTLRRRRSSLTVGTSPMNAIKSPQRNAGNALHLQQKLPPPLPSMGPVGRGRSGSLNLLSFGFGGSGNASGNEPAMQIRTAQETNVASQATSLMGRMRSGSIGGSSFGNLFRSRRNVRRLASLPAPVAPPPTLPLPAVPDVPTPNVPETPKHTKSFSLFHNTSIFSNPKFIFSQVANTRQPLAQHTGTNSEVSPPLPISASNNSEIKKGRGRAFSCAAGVSIDSRIDEEVMKEN